MQSQLVALLAVGLMATGCTLSPLHNDVQPLRSDPVTVSGFTVAEGHMVTVQCRPYLTGGSWTTIGTTHANSGPYALTQGDLWYFNTNVVVPNGCWYGWHNQYTTELRFRGGDDASIVYAAFDDEGHACVIDAVVDGDDYLSARDDCQLKTSSGTAATSLYLHAED